jgi:superoxide dismutase, Cu-Zn family
MEKSSCLVIASLCLLSIHSADAASKAKAVATLTLKSGGAGGTATFVATNHGVLIEYDLKGLRPGPHGIYLHTSGNCSAANGFASAGPHLAFDDKKAHGYLAPHGPHPGDLPNEFAASDGTLRASVTDSAFSLGNGKKSIFDKDGVSLIVDAGADDYTTQPDGHAGARIACGVIARTVAPGSRKGGKRKAHT